MAPASAHVTATPAFLYAKGMQTVTLSGPNERDEPMTGFSATVPRGLRITAAYSDDGWEPDVEGSTATWTGGSLAPSAEASFVLDLELSREPGTVALEVAQLYPGGADVRWPVALTVVPGNAFQTEQVGRCWECVAIVGAVGLVFFAVIVLVARRVRRQPLQEK